MTTTAPAAPALAAGVAEEVMRAATAVSVPRAAPADSFVLHAPLELLARVGLLPLVDPAERERAVAAITALAAAYEQTGPPVDPPAPLAASSLDDAAAHLDAAIRAGDAEGADAALLWLATRADHRTLRHRVSEAIVDSLAAAGHAPIALHLLPRVGGGALPATLLRGAVRTISDRPEWRVRWFRTADARPDRTDARVSELDVATSLARVPHIGRPGSDFIHPLMAQVEERGVAARHVQPMLSADVTVARRTLLRAAAWSMLHDDPTQAPYGWSHCLTMPQAVMSLADDGVEPRTALAVAGTFVVGFRAAHGLTPLGSLDDDAGRPVDARRVPAVSDLASFAALHHDAHLVKYTLACIHAAAADPAWAGTYLEAAAYLADWWWQHPRGA